MNKYMLGFIIRRTLAANAFSLKANTLSDNAGARRKAKRVGRGQGSGKGKTSGRGTKGDNAREGGGVPPRFEGGQTPLTIRLPKWGMNRRAFKEPLDPLNFNRLYYYIEKNRIDPSKVITIRDIFEAGVFSRIKHGVKLLAGGLDKIDRPLHFEVTDASQSAIDAVKSKGGSVTLIYKTDVQLKYHIKPYKFDFPINETATPPPNKAIHLKGKENKGAIVKFNRPQWLDSWSPPVVPPIPKFIRKPKPKIARHIDYGIKTIS
jgi:large subunit ribosomal protein L15